MLEAKGTNFEAQLAPHCKVVIGDENASYFRPHLAVDRWGGEGRLSFGIPTTERIQPTFDGTTLEWVSGNAKHRFYLIAPDGNDHEFGGVEYELVLGAHPGTPTIPLPFDLAGLDAFFQGPLTGPRAASAVRPPHVLNSFAFYHATKGIAHTKPGDADKYRAGKAFHLYRPLATDRRGVKWWVDLTMDRLTRQMALVIGPEFLTAVYPVTIDPTIGYSTLPGTQDDTDNFKVSSNFAAPGDGEANPGTIAACTTADSGTLGFKMGVYSNVANAPTTLLSSTVTGTATTTKQFVSGSITWTGITNGTNYFLAIACNVGGNTFWDTATLQAAYTAVPLYSAELTSAFGTPTDWDDHKLGVYVDYTAAGGGATHPGWVGQGWW